MVFRRLRALANGGNSYAEIKLLESALSGALGSNEIDDALAKSADINCVWVKSPNIGSADQTPLMVYSKSEGVKLEIVEYLLLNQANPKIRAKFGHTALSLLTSRPYFAERIEIIKALVEAGANPRNVNASGETPLHKLSRTGSVEELELLLKASPQGAINYSKSVFQGFGFGPLHCAISSAGGPGLPRLPVIKLLISLGADINRKTKCSRKMTPLGLAMKELQDNELASAKYERDPDWLVRQKHHTREIVSFLQSKGAV